MQQQQQQQQRMHHHHNLRHDSTLVEPAHEATTTTSTVELLRQAAAQMFHQQSRDLTNLAQLTSNLDTMKEKEHACRQRLAELQRLRGTQEADIERQTQRNKERTVLTQKLEAALRQLTESHAQLQDALQAGSVVQNSLDEFTKRFLTPDSELMSLLDEATNLLHGATAAEYKSTGNELRRQSAQLAQFSELLLRWVQDQTQESLHNKRNAKEIFSSQNPSLEVSTPPHSTISFSLRFQTSLDAWEQALIRFTSSVHHSVRPAFAELPRTYQRVKELCQQLEQLTSAATADASACPLPSDSMISKMSSFVDSHLPSSAEVSMPSAEMTEQQVLTELEGHMNAIRASQHAAAEAQKNTTDGVASAAMFQSMLPAQWDSDLTALFREYFATITELKCLHEQHACLSKQLSDLEEQHAAATVLRQETESKLQTIRCDSANKLEALHCLESKTEELQSVLANLSHNTHHLKQRVEELNAIGEQKSWELAEVVQQADAFFNERASLQEEVLQQHVVLLESAQRDSLAKRESEKARFELNQQMAELDEVEALVERISNQLSTICLQERHPQTEPSSIVESLESAIRHSISSVGSAVERLGRRAALQEVVPEGVGFANPSLERCARFVESRRESKEEQCREFLLQKEATLAALREQAKAYSVFMTEACCDMR